MGDTSHKTGEIVFIDRRINTSLIYSGIATIEDVNERCSDKFHRCMIKNILRNYRTIDRTLNLYNLIIERTGNELYVEEIGIVKPNDPNFMFLLKKRR